MAVVYFTSNASTGAGSLAEAVKNASPGDVIRPDETVFERGSTIEIVLASQLNVDKNLTLDASPFRVRLDGGGARTCAAVASGVIAEFTAFDFVRGYAAITGGCVYSSGTLTLRRCGVYGGSAMYAGGIFAKYGLTLNDCVVAGCRASESGGGLTLQGESALNGVAIIGNAAARGADVLAEQNGRLTATNSIIGVVRVANGAPNPTYIGSVANVAPSTVGFVASPPDDLTPENWNANAWQDWDLRLLDDASGAPSPYRDSGNVGAMSRYDLDGNFRGRETNDVATCSPGAYETIQADLFWIGADANGAEVVSPSFLTSDGWAASRFATVAGDVAPSAGDRLFVGVSATFNDAAPTNAYIVIGAVPVIIETNGGGLVTPIGCNFNYSGTLDSMRLADWSRISTGGTASLPPIDGGANLIFSGVSVSVIDGVIFSTVESPSGLTAVNGGGWADVTAGVTSVSATALNENTVEAAIEKTDADKTAFAQYSDDGGVTWENIATSPNVDVYELSVSAGSFAIVRAAINGGWLTAIASTAEFTPVWTVSAATESVIGVVNAFEISTGGSNTGNNSYNLSGWGTL